MKKWRCDGCKIEIEVYDEYEPKFCCAGRMEDMCGCMGQPVNPVFCDDCERRLGILGQVNEKQEHAVPDQE